MNHRLLLPLAALTLIATSLSPVAAQRAAKKAGKAVQGQITSISAEGFELKTGTKKMPSTVPAKITTSAGTKYLAIKAGALADIKEKDLVVVVGTPGADGKIAATGLLRLPGNAVGREEKQLLPALANSARRMLGGGKRAAAAAPAAGPPAAPAARRKGNKPQASQVVSLSPLKVSQGGQTLEVVLPAGSPVAVVAPITVSDLKAGDTVAVLGTTTPGTDASQPSVTAAQFVVKSPGRKRKNQ